MPPELVSSDTVRIDNEQVFPNSVGMHPVERQGKQQVALIVLRLCRLRFSNAMKAQSLILSGGVVLGVLVTGGIEVGAEQAPESAVLRSSSNGVNMGKLREAAKNRKRRLIYNSDGGDMYGYNFSSVDEFLRRRTDRAVGTQVDSIFYCTGDTLVYSHDTDVAERFDDLMDDLGKTDEQASRWRNNMAVLRKAGLDQLSATVRRAHAGGLEIFWSHRINDTHDSVPEYDHLLAMWKRRNPEFLMGVPEDTEKHPQASPAYWWSTLDFEKSEVRDYLFRITEEVCRRYDIDGVEIDYFRYPMFFRPNLHGHPATNMHLEILTEFQRSILRMTAREGERRGRPILVAVRVPAAINACRNVGIDIERWMREGLVDVLSLGNGHAWPNVPAEKMVRLSRRYSVPVYPCLKWSGYGPATIESFRAAAANVWHTGADGIYFFNIDIFPDTLRPLCFDQLGDPKKLLMLDKLFAATDFAPYLRLLADPATRHCGLAEVCSEPMALPAELYASGSPHNVTLQIGDDIPLASGKGILASATLTVRLSDPAIINFIQIRLNDQQLVPIAKDAEQSLLVFNPKPDWYRAGLNSVSFRLAKIPETISEPPRVLTVEVDVQYVK